MGQSRLTTGVEPLDELKKRVLEQVEEVKL